MKKKLLIMSLVFVALLSLTSGCGKKKEKKEEENKPEVEDNVEVFDDQTVEGLVFKNAALIYENEETTITVTIRNNTDNDIEMTGITIRLYDKDDNMLKEIPSYVSELIKSSKEQSLIQTVTSDLSKAKRIEYIIKR